MKRLTGSRALAALVVLVWVGWVLHRYRSVDPSPAGTPVLAAGVFLVLLTLAAYGAGAGLLRLVTRRSPSDVAGALVAVTAGAGTLMAAAACLSLVGLLRPPAIASVAAVALVLGVAEGIGVARRCAVSAGSKRAPQRHSALAVPLVVTLLAGGIAVLAVPTLAPFYDQFNYQLAFPFQWLRAGHLEVFTRHAYSFLPANMGLLFVYGLSTAGVWAGQAIHWWMGAIATGAVWVLGRRLAGPRAGAWAAAMFAASPSAIEMSSWAAVDLATAAFGLAGWVLVLEKEEGSSDAPARAGVFVAGIFAGLAAGCKILAAATVAVPMLAGVIVSRRIRRDRRAWRAVLLWGAGAALALAPWLVRSQVLTGNPLYPFLNRVFPPHRLSERAGADVVEAAGMVASFPSHRLAPVERLTLGTFNPQGFAGSIGPVFLASVPLALWAGLVWRRRCAAAVLAGFLVSIAGWWFAPQLGRYLAPALGLLSVLAGAGWARFTAGLPASVSRWLTLLLAGALAANLGAGLASSIDRIACTFGVRSEEEMLSSQVSCWQAVSLVNRELPRDAKILLVAESRTLFLERDFVVEDPFVRPLLVGLAESEVSVGAMAERLKRRGITHVLYNHQEAARIAALNGRSEYLAPLSPAGRERLSTFLEHCLRRLAVAGPVEVFALEPCRP